MHCLSVESQIRPSLFEEIGAATTLTSWWWWCWRGGDVVTAGWWPVTAAICSTTTPSTVVAITPGLLTFMTVARCSFRRPESMAVMHSLRQVISVRFGLHGYFRKVASFTACNLTGSSWPLCLAFPNTRPVQFLPRLSSCVKIAKVRFLAKLARDRLSTKILSTTVLSRAIEGVLLVAVVAMGMVNSLFESCSSSVCCVSARMYWWFAGTQRSTPATPEKRINILINNCMFHKLGSITKAKTVCTINQWSTIPCWFPNL